MKNALTEIMLFCRAAEMYLDCVGLLPVGLDLALSKVFGGSVLSSAIMNAIRGDFLPQHLVSGRVKQRMEFCSDTAIRKISPVPATL
jgi:hypothetical protein